MRTLQEDVIRNSAVNVASFSWQKLLAFFVTPYIVWRIGQDAFGLWALVVSIVSVCSLLDFDLAHAFVKYIAEYNASGERDKLNRVVSTGLLLYLAFGAAVVGIVWVIAPSILYLFPDVSCSETLYDDGLFVLKVAALIYGMETGLSALTCVPRGVQRLDLEKIVLTAQATLAAIGTVIALELGYGIRGLLVNYLVTSAIACAAKIIIASRLLPSLRVSPFLFSVETVKQLFPFCWRLEVMKFSQWANLRLDKVLIGRFVSLEAVTWYHFASIVVGLVRQVPMLLVASLMPAFSELSVTRSGRAFHASVMRATKYVALVAIGMSFYLAFEAGTVILAWVGPGYDVSATVIRILAVGYCANIAVGGGFSSAVIGMGRPGVQMRASVMNAVMNTVLSVALITWFGFYGAPLGTTIAMVLSALYFAAMFQALFSAEERTPCLIIFLKAVLAGGMACAAFPAVGAALGPLAGADRTVLLVRLAVDAVCYGVLYLATLVAGGYFDERDKSVLLRYVPFIQRRKG